MVINSREIAVHLARLSQLLESNSAYYAALNQFEGAAGQLSREAKEIAELASFLYDVKENIELPSPESEYSIIGYLNGIAPNAIFSDVRKSEFSIPVYVKNKK